MVDCPDCGLGFDDCEGHEDPLRTAIREQAAATLDSIARAAKCLRKAMRAMDRARVNIEAMKTEIYEDSTDGR